MYVMPITFLSGIFYPFESFIVYFFPPFWANALYRQCVVLGHDFWTDYVQITSNNPLVEEFIPIPLWEALLIIIGFLTLTLIIGIVLFQRKILK